MSQYAKVEANDQDEKIETVYQDMLQTTQRILGYCDQTYQIGQATATKLAEQGEKLQKFDDNINRLDQGVNQVEADIDQLKKSKLRVGFQVVSEYMVRLVSCGRRSRKGKTGQQKLERRSKYDTLLNESSEEESFDGTKGQIGSKHTQFESKYIF
jgi:hypothetical protein